MAENVLLLLNRLVSLINENPFNSLYNKIMRNGEIRITVINILPDLQEFELNLARLFLKNDEEAGLIHSFSQLELI